MGQAPDIWTKVGQINLPEAAIAQLRATIPNVNRSAYAGSVKAEGVKREPNTSAAETAIKSTKTQGVRTDAVRPRQGSKDKATPKPDPKKSRRKSNLSRKKRPGRDSSPDSSDPSSDSDEDDSDSSSSSDSSGEEARSSTKTSSKAEVGSTLLTVRPYVNPNSLEKFDEKASLGDRRSWWERFLNMNEQGGWMDKVKLSELRMKMSSAVRNWRGQLPKHVQADWEKLSREFRHKYLKTRTSESERYYTMKQESGETPLEFLYRLNEAAVKGGIKFHDVDDLEYVLHQDEDLAQGGEYDTPPPKSRDFRADNVHPGRFKPRRPGRAYVVQSDAESDAEQDRHVRFDDEVEDIETGIPEGTALPRSVLERPILEAAPNTPSSRPAVTDEDIRNAVFRVMKHSGWRPVKTGGRPGWQSPRRENPDRNDFCSEYRKFGHKPENCWKDIVCDRCSRLGHPVYVCKVQPCNYCGKYHDRQCQEYQAVEASKDLVRKGMLKDLPQSTSGRRGKSGSAVKLVSPLDGDPERAGLKRSQGLCVLVRTKIVLDIGTAVSTTSLDLASRLKLKLRMRDPIRVFGLGGVPTYISASASIKITLGPRIVYFMTVYVANIGEGLEVLLGMNFMYAAGVRLSLRDGLIQLPDEETVIRYGQSNPRREVVWAGRADRWVTQIIYGAKSWAVAVKVENISPRMVWIDTGTAVARIVEFGCFPSAGRWVRPGRLKYNEWQQLIYESVPSLKMRRRVEEIERIRRESEPPCVQRPEYEWPTKLMLRPRPGPTQVRIARLPGRPDTQDEGQSSRATQEVCTQTFQTSDAGTQTDVVQEPQTEEVLEVDSAGETDGLRERAEKDDGPECSDSHVQEDSGENNEIEDCPSQAMLGTPLYKLEQEYARCMRVNLRDLDLEPAVYIQEGSELIPQLCDDLAMIPELNHLSPECDITQADVGEPGRTTPDEDRNLRTVLEYHRKIFLGDGNAAPAPARGVVCDLDVGKTCRSAFKVDRPTPDAESIRIAKEVIGDQVDREFGIALGLTDRDRVKEKRRGYPNVH
ncbi:unnamed protein product [Phytophthora fragariaefolia]|uniref:Unnamed protein product n=1 Tax=Phytophthora fragariaefolia TaxID=1490495 RepID=A0A9W6YMQ6_9STRA|nr:unnamed protein product [Phytophthora fragariaefolia]